jgi:hypothetical protein
MIETISKPSPEGFVAREVYVVLYERERMQQE